jgi:LysR family nitrogen assimilation transcriptional regulator
LLGIAQPAISRQVRSLEVELRQSLLRRNGRGALPTEAGKRLLDHARSILQQVERARREVDEVKGAPVGHVVIGLPPTLALALTATVVREFRRRFPRASVSIVEGLSVHIHDWVVVGRADVGVLYNPVPSAAVEVRPLVDEQLCLVSRRAPRRQAASVKLRDLPAYPLIIPSRPNAIRALVDARLATLGMRPQVALEIDAIGAILELVAEGQGHAVLSRRAIEVRTPASSSRDRSCSRRSPPRRDRRVGAAAAVTIAAGRRDCADRTAAARRLAIASGLPVSTCRAQAPQALCASSRYLRL